MEFDFDVIVIGSGFGGSIMTCRLAEKNYRVCLLERGRRWGMHEFPRRINEVKKDMFWDPEDKKYGTMEFCDSPESDAMTLTASGLGGGSLIYANVLLRMPEVYFKGWPYGINSETLEPFYKNVISTMEASPYPLKENNYYADTPKSQIYETISKNITKSSDGIAEPRFFRPDLAVRFNGNFPGEQSKNSHGATQSSCIKCGECDIGCNIHAKNTLDLNYIFRAQNNVETKAEVRTNAEVTEIKKIESGGYYVTYKNPYNKNEITTIKSKKVVLSAGSIGSTTLLLKMKKNDSFQNISPMLGKKWCGNGDLLGTVLKTKHNVESTKGPVITSVIEYKFENYPDGFPHGFYIEDAGYPVGLIWYLAGKIPSTKTFKSILKLVSHFIIEKIQKVLGIKSKNAEINIGNELASALDRDNDLKKAMMLLGMGRDRSDGEIILRNDNRPVIKWDIEKSQLHYDRLRREMKKIAAELEGEFADNPLTYLDKIVAVHPLGGCPMGETESEGVVNDHGEVFNHPGLFVVDGSIIPTSTGPNPSLTIAAMAEMIASKFPNNKN